MKKIKKFGIKYLKTLIRPLNLIIFVLLILVLFFGFKYRYKDYTQVPFPGENADEYSFGWLGISLLKDHYPIAWSGIGGYKTHDYEKINVDNIYGSDPNRPAFSIDKPWFDHPPLMGLLVGGFAYLKGVRDFKDASIVYLRKPMLAIGVLDIILVFILAFQLFGKRVGIISAILYSLIPTIVISSRLALAENALIPLFLIALIFAFKFIKTNKKYWWTSASVVGGLAVLFKLSGLAIPLSLFFIALTFINKGRWKMAAYPLVGALAAILIFALYGAIFDWTTFVNVFKANSERFFGAGPEIFYNILTNQRIVRNYTDGWITASFISFFITLFWGWKKDFSIKFLSIAFFSYLMIFLIFGSEPYGNYRFPFYPLTIISLAYVFSKLWDEQNIVFALPLTLMPLGTMILRIKGITDFQPFVPYFRGGVIISLLVFFSGYIFDKKKSLIIYRIFLLGVASLLIYWVFRELNFINVDKWYFVN